MIHDRAAELGIDPNRIVLGGSSAGAHLAAMVVLALRGESCHGEGVRIHELILVSGIYWVEPLVGTSINEALQLTTKSAQDQSPGLRDLTEFPFTRIIFGEIETEQFKAQSYAFGQRIQSFGGSVEFLEVHGRNHFDVTLGPLLG